jgi:putative transposase
VRPLERVECDETKLDLMVIDTETRLPLGRPWLTTMIDVCTKMITGFYLSFHPPGYLSVMRCLLHAIRPKWGSGRNFDFCCCKMKVHFVQWFARP